MTPPTQFISVCCSRRQTLPAKKHLRITNHVFLRHARLLKYLLTVILSLGCVSLFAQAKKNKFALLIGSPVVNAREETKPGNLKEMHYYDDLTPAVNIDLQKMKTLLLRAGYQESDILVMKDPQLSRISIERAIDSVRTNLESNASFLLYFTGHGQQIPDQGVKDEPDSMDETLVLPSEYWVDDDINEMFTTKLSTYNNVFIVDACASGSSYQLASIGMKDRNSSSYNFIDNYFYHAQIVSETGCRPFITQVENRFKLIYFGASGDLQRSKAGTDGSWLTGQIDIISKRAVFKQFTYRSLACFLSNRSQTESIGFDPVYAEIGNVTGYNSQQPLKP